MPLKQRNQPKPNQGYKLQRKPEDKFPLLEIAEQPKLFVLIAEGMCWLILSFNLFGSVFFPPDQVFLMVFTPA